MALELWRAKVFRQENAALNGSSFGWSKIEKGFQNGLAS
jgi:hypothetical protein